MNEVNVSSKGLGDIEMIEAERDELKKLSHRLLTQMHQMHEELESCISKLQLLEKEKTRLKLRLESNEGWVKNYQKFKGSNEELNTIDYRDEAAQSSNSQVEPPDFTIEDDDSHPMYYQYENQMLIDQICMLQEKVDGFDSKIQQIYNSTSWKITRPLRFVVFFLRSKMRNDKYKL